MSEQNESAGAVVLKWAHLGLVMLVQVLLMGAIYGSLKFQVEDHARRLDAIEKKQDADFIPRSEYDKRHSDLQEDMHELRQEVRDLEQKMERK